MTTQTVFDRALEALAILRANRTVQLSHSAESKVADAVSAILAAKQAAVDASQEDAQTLGEVMGCPPGINRTTFAKHIAAQAELYRWLRDDDNWCDDGDAWVLLGELGGTEFDDFIRARMRGDPIEVVTSDCEISSDAQPVGRFADNAAMEGQEISVDVSTSEDDARHRVYAQLTGKVVPTGDGTVWLAKKTGQNFPAPDVRPSEMELRNEIAELRACLDMVVDENSTVAPSVPVSDETRETLMRAVEGAIARSEEIGEDEWYNAKELQLVSSYRIPLADAEYIAALTPVIAFGLLSQPVSVQGVTNEEMLRREIHNLKRHIEDYCQPAAPVQPNCREFGPVKGVCIQCANGNYEQCRYLAASHPQAAQPQEAGACTEYERGFKDGQEKVDVFRRALNAVQAAPSVPNGWKLLTPQEILVEQKRLIDSSGYDAVAFAQHIERLTLERVGVLTTPAAPAAPSAPLVIVNKGEKNGQ